MGFLNLLEMVKWDDGIYKYDSLLGFYGLLSIFASEASVHELSITILFLTLYT
jgi:hypothetical protein